MTRSRAWGPAMLGLLGGAVAGALYWTLQMRSSRRDLFSGHRLRRVAALSWVAAHPSVHNARALRDYVRWERNPTLRRRAERVLRRMEHTLVA